MLSLCGMRMCHSLVPEQSLTQAISSTGFVYNSCLGQDRKGEVIVNEGMAKKQYKDRIYDAFYALKLKANCL